MKLNQLGRYVLIGGGVLVMLSASTLVGARLAHRRYQNQNEKAFEAVGRELSGTNWNERERIQRMQAAGRWTLGIGIVAMGVGGVFCFYGAKEL